MHFLPKKLKKKYNYSIIHKKYAKSLTKFYVNIKKPTRMVGFLL